MPIADQDIKKLWGLAAARCSRPDCGTDCVKFFGSDPTVLGEMAHIIAKQPRGRRGVPGGGSNAYDNLILLCPTHHTEIDKAPEGSFPVALLHQWKGLHERRVREALAVKSYDTRAELFRDVRFLLIDNFEIWKTYGPASEEAQRNPMSNTAQFWQLRKVGQIVPNNAKICAALDGSRSLLTPEEYALAAQFKEHAAGFAANAIERVEGYPTFPRAFRELVEKHDNGANNWAVLHSSIRLFERMLTGHQNVAHVTRSHDIMFTLTRKKPPDCIRILTVNTYTFGMADFYRARAEFPEVTCIVLAGEWNAYTLDAKERANMENIGLLTPKELVAAIWREEPHNYFTKDRHGHPIYHIRAA